MFTSRLSVVRYRYKNYCVRFEWNSAWWLEQSGRWFW